MSMFDKIKQTIKKLTVKEYYNGISDFSVPVNAWSYDELDIASSGDPFREVTEIDAGGLVRRFQASSGSCVSQSCALINTKKTGVIASAVPIWQRRSNKPATGMSYADVIKLLPTVKISKESDVPSQNMTDAQMDAQDIVYKGTELDPVVEPLTLNKSFYEVAQAVRQHGIASIWFRCSVNNWLKWIMDKCDNSNEVGHSVAVIDAVKYKGVNYLIFLDSAGHYTRDPNPQPEWIKTYGIRAITEEAFNQGVYNQWTVVDIKKIDTTIQKPVYKFTAPLFFGMLNNNDVRKLQEILIYEGMLDKRAVTGNYKNMTRSAVKAFQVKYKVATMAEINQVNGMRCGQKTINKLNELYA